MLQINYINKEGEEVTKEFATLEEAVSFLNLNADLLDLSPEEIIIAVMLLTEEEGEQQ